MQITNVTHKNLYVEISKSRGKYLFIAESQDVIQTLNQFESLDQLNSFIITSRTKTISSKIPTLDLNQF